MNIIIGSFILLVLLLEISTLFKLRKKKYFMRFNHYKKFPAQLVRSFELEGDMLKLYKYYSSHDLPSLHKLKLELLLMKEDSTDSFLSNTITSMGIPVIIGIVSIAATFFSNDTDLNSMVGGGMLIYC